MTTVALPEMKKYAYKPALSSAAIACGSTLGVVIPPSVVLIVYGIYTEQSIGKLFWGQCDSGADHNGVLLSDRLYHLPGTAGNGSRRTENVHRGKDQVNSRRIRDDRALHAGYGRSLLRRVYAY